MVDEALGYNFESERPQVYETRDHLIVFGRVRDDLLDRILRISR